MNKRNGGLADARNVGLRHVKGTWLCMLDSDDLLGRDYLHRAADLIEEDGHVDIIPGWGFASRWFTRFDSTPTHRASRLAVDVIASRFGSFGAWIATFLACLYASGWPMLEVGRSDQAGVE